MPAWRWRIQVRGIRLGLALLLALLGCATAEPPAPTIEDRDWYLVAIGTDTQIAATEAARPTLRFVANGGRAQGFGGCNSFSGPYRLESDTLKLGPLASTKMYCAETAALESRYFAALDQVTGFALAGDQLTLLAGTTPLLRFRELAQTRRVK